MSVPERLLPGPGPSPVSPRVMQSNILLFLGAFERVLPGSETAAIAAAERAVAAV